MRKIKNPETIEDERYNVLLSKLEEGSEITQEEILKVYTNQTSQWLSEFYKKMLVKNYTYYAKTQSYKNKFLGD